MNRYIENPKVGAPVLQSTRVLDQLRERIRYLHYSLQTEKAYVYWARFFIRWHGRSAPMRHPRLMGQPEVLGHDLPWMQSIGRPPERKRIPVVLTVAEVRSVLALMDGAEGILARLLYGTGMRLAEGLNLRVKDVDFDRYVIVVRSGKGDKDRVVMLPRSLANTLRGQLARSRALWAADRASLQSGVYMPHALEAKYPRAGQSWSWHWVFPADKVAAGGTASPLDALARHEVREPESLYVL